MLGRRKRRGPRRRILFVTDLHGSEYTFRKLLRALETWRPDVYVAGGDVAGKGLLPILQGNGRCRLRWMGEEREIEAGELPAYQERAAQLGFYPYRAQEDELAAMRADEARVEAVFERLMLERWADWLDRLEARCAELRIPAYVMAGNDDPWSLDGPAGENREWARAADGRVLPLAEEWTLMSCGLANPTPWGCPRDVAEEELASRLQALAAQVPDPTKAIANIHVPPYGSSLDVAPLLDTSVSPPRPVAGETAAVGSTAVARFIEQHQPLLSLHGHIHESPGVVRIGRTLAINPGSEYAEGVLRGALVTVEPGRVVGHQFVNG